jgi:hypothetical protein
LRKAGHLPLSPGVLLMRPSSSLLESLIQQNYSETELPPLWQVIYQEAIRGHHLLFKRADVDLFETIQMNAHTADYGVFESLEEIVVDLVSSNDLNTMIQIIDALPITQRHSLFLFYQRALWIWKNYSKDQLN